MGGAFANYVIMTEYIVGPYIALVPADCSEKAQLERMNCTSVTGMLAERFYMNEAYLKTLN